MDSLLNWLNTVTRFNKVDISDAVLLLVVIALAVALPRINEGQSRQLADLYARIARSRYSALFVGLLTLLASALVTLRVHYPEPHIYDEFSYLLAAETFAAGRITNPLHPLWQHFESFCINVYPTYMSKYPPGQGLFLAAGKLLAGEPIVGVWISIALACAATTWMLRGWTAPRWALLGGLLMMLRFGIFSYWSNSYWGGAVAALGGALFFGAVPRIMRNTSVGNALWLALGLVLLAISRPYEGLLATIPAMLMLAGWLVSKKAPAFKVTIPRFILPVALVMALLGVALGYYNWRITGNALKMPYMLHEQQYHVSPIYIWSKPYQQPTYNHEVFHRYFVGWHYRQYESNIKQPGTVFTVKVMRLWKTYLGFLLTLPLLALPWMWRNRWMRLAALTCLLVMVGIIGVTYILPHYAAPVTCLLFALVVQGLRHLRLWRPRTRPVGLTMARLLPLAAALMIIARMVYTDNDPWPQLRADMLARLKAEEGRHLVIVRYGPQHSPLNEWVYNEADIDNAKVVWAREMDSERQRRLLDYYRDRKVWLLDVDYDYAPQLYEVTRAAR